MKWREDLLPTDCYHRVWQELQQQFKPYEACRLMVEGLYLAAQHDKEYIVGLWMEKQLRSGTLTFKALQDQFTFVPPAPLTVNTVEQHPLAPYDQLLHYDDYQHHPTCPPLTVTIPPSPLHETTLA